MVSIILSVYNGERSLERALKSVANQTYKDWELIAVNDASTDGSLRILERFKQKFPDKVRIFNNAANLGLTRSLNIGIEAAQGEYIARLDDDDWYDPEKTAKQEVFLREHQDYGVVGCMYENIFINSIGREKKELIKKPVTDKEIRSYLFWGNPFGHSCVMVRKEILARAGGYDDSVAVGQDYDLWWKISKIAKIANLPDILCWRTVAGKSISVKRTKEQMRQGCRTLWKHGNRIDPRTYLGSLHLYMLAQVLPITQKLLIRRK